MSEPQTFKHDQVSKLQTNPKFLKKTSYPQTQIINEPLITTPNFQRNPNYERTPNLQRRPNFQ